MAFQAKGTMTGQAINFITDKSFTAAHGARPGVTKVGIVFTDGRSQDYIGEAAKKAKDSGKRERKAHDLIHKCSVIHQRASFLCYLCSLKSLL